MADQKDQYVAGPPDEPRPSAGAGPEAAAGPGASAEPKADPGPAAAHRSPPPVPPQGPPPGPQYASPAGPGDRGAGVRAWAQRRPAQLLVAGVIGAILGGGAVGLLDVLDDDHDMRGHRYYMPYGPGHGGEGYGPRHWKGPYDGPMMPGRRDWREWGQRPGMPQAPPEQPAPTAPASPTP